MHPIGNISRFWYSPVLLPEVASIKFDLPASTDGYVLVAVDTQWTEADHRITEWRIHALEWAIIQFRDDFTGSCGCASITSYFG